MLCKILFWCYFAFTLNESSQVSSALGQKEENLLGKSLKHFRYNEFVIHYLACFFFLWTIFSWVPFISQLAKELTRTKNSPRAIAKFLLCLSDTVWPLITAQGEFVSFINFLASSHHRGNSHSLSHEKLLGDTEKSMSFLIFFLF